jgi:hypothetical protein
VHGPDHSLGACRIAALALTTVLMFMTVMQLSL